MKSTTVVVVGAGPAGLACAYHLQQRHIPYVVLERGRVGEAWHNHYDSLNLHTLKEVSGLPGWPMPCVYPTFPSRQQVVDYLQQYAQRFALNIDEGVTVMEASYDEHKWQLQTSAGQYQAQALIVATGIWSTPYWPHFVGQEQFEGQILHAQAYRHPQPFVGQRVLVVGVGNTGSEVAVELSAAGINTAVIAIEGAAFVPYPTSAHAMRVAAWVFRHLPERWGSALLAWSRPEFAHLGLPWPARPLTQVYPVVGFELPEAVAAGQIAVYQSGIACFTPEGVQLTDGRVLAVDTVILATGYRPTVQFVQPYLELDSRGWPILHNWQSTHHERLFCVGFTYPNTEGWLQALPRVSRQAVTHLARVLSLESHR